MASIDKNAMKKFQKSYFDVLGICCSSEVPLIDKILKSLDGVKDVTVIVPTKTVIVIHDGILISQLQIVKALNQARLEANIRAYGDKKYQKKWPSPYAIACGVLLLLSFLKFFFPPLKWLAIGAVGVGIIPIFLKALAAIQNFRIDTNILVLFAVAGSIAMKDYWEAGTIVFLFTIAEWLQSTASHKATVVLSSLVNVVPQRAVIAETGEEVDADEVKVNTILAVKAGEIIPIDGIVIEGNCEVDEKTLTGESFPVAKEKDSTVWAGTINLNGYVSVKTTAVAEDCVVARMAKLVEDAQNNKSRTQRLVDKCAKYYLPVVVLLSVAFVIIPAALRLHNQKEWYRLALVILVSACPCALVLSTPIAMFCALSKAGTSGLLFKGAEYLETLAKVKIIAFDKTGTITRGEFEVTDFRSLVDDVDLETMLYWVSSIESKSSHPMASALINYGQSHSAIPKPEIVGQFQNFPGEGIYGKIDEKDIYVGNWKIALRAGCATVPTFEDDTKEGESIGYVFLGSHPAGIFSLSDVCRSGVKEALKELKMMGIKTAMLTGDSYGAAKYAQNQLGGALDIIHAELLPEDKARIVQEFQKEAPTAMVGDGLNDAPALAAADIGISMGVSGSALATETGNVILMSNDIKKIPKATRLARRVRRKIIENVIISISTKTAIVALAIAGHPFVWAAVLADVGTCLLVIFNSMLLLRGTHHHGKRCGKSGASHVHKSKCKTTSCQSSHTHRACCPDTGAHEKHESRNFSSDTCNGKSQSDPLTSESYGDKKCSESIAKHGCHSHNHSSGPIAKHSCHSHNNSSGAITKHGCHSHNHSSGSIAKHGSHSHNHSSTGAKETDHGCYEVLNQETGPCGGHNHGCADHLAPGEENKSANSAQKHSGCAENHEIHDTEHCSHIGHGSTALEKSTSSLDCTNHSTDQPRDEELGHQVEKCCKAKPANQEVLSGCKNHKKECGAPARSTINILRGNNHSHGNCNGGKACSTFEKKQVGGCCRTKCCPKSAHLGAGFRGGLSEIVIE